MKNTINHELCKKCKLCINVCPVNIIEIDKKGLVNFIAEREKICLECGQCMAVCSTDAVKIPKYTYSDNFIELPENKIDFKEYINFISNRRSIRNFKETKIEEKTFNQILSSLDFAPYGAEPNKTEITIINNRSTIEKTLAFIEKFLDDIVKWIENPIIRFMIKRKKGMETFNTLKNHLYPMAKLENYKLKYGDRITRNAPAIIIFHAKKNAEEHTNNSLIYATYCMLAAQSLGLGTSMNGIVPAAINKIPEVRKIFSIPENHEAIISLTIGYPKYKYKKTVKREQKTIHWVK